MRRGSVRILLTAILIPAGFAALPVAGASANTQCGNSYTSYNANSGVTGNGGSTYWGWCRANGGYVRFRMTLDCPYGGGGTTAWASGSGDVTVYTEPETCWLASPYYDWQLQDG